MKKIEILNLCKDLNLKYSNVEKIILKETGLSKSQLFLAEEINDEFKSNILKQIKDYSNGLPLEYIISEADFYSEVFYVNSNVLIPRDDTEIMVDKAIEEALMYSNITLIDVWTGTSCIPISIIKNSSKIENCYVIDISEKALDVSLKNIQNHKLERKIQQLNSDLLSEIAWNTWYKLNKNIIITANLPYIKDWDFENIDNETMEYEPSLALYWWKETGFELYEKLINQVFQLKKLNNISNIILFIEIGFDQKDYSKQYIQDLWLKWTYFKDNSGINRCIKIVF